MTTLIRDLKTWHQWRRTTRGANGLVGFVPTMGALHPGHLSLLRQARAEGDCVVASVFVNPTQFDDPADLARYPQDLDADVRLVEGLADVVFAPSAAELYPDGYRFRITETDESRRFEGAQRPGHFDGVLTVVMKLLQIVQADAAYFGEKDWQQLALVRGMAAAFFLPTRIVGCPTVRESDGLALSSRNRRLPPEARRRAAGFAAALRLPAPDDEVRSQLESAGFAVDYIGRSGPVRVGAVRIAGVRLIDNVRMEETL